MFKVGDRVEAVKEFKIAGFDLEIGDKGVVKVVDSDGTFGIECDRFIDGGWLSGKGKDGHCYWADAEDIKLIEAPNDK